MQIKIKSFTEMKLEESRPDIETWNKWSVEKRSKWLTEHPKSKYHNFGGCIKKEGKDGKEWRSVWNGCGYTVMSTDSEHKVDSIFDADERDEAEARAELLNKENN